MNWMIRMKILFVAAGFMAMCAVPSWAQMGDFEDMEDMKKRAREKMKERHAGENEGPGGPPMLVLIPPPDAEKPEGVEMSDDPEERHGQILETFFRMMDGDHSGELNFDELGSWAHPAPMMGPGMGGEMDEEMRQRMEEEIRHHVEQEIRHQLEEEMKHRMEEMRGGGDGGDGDGGGGDMEEEIRRRVEHELQQHMREMRREHMHRMAEELREMRRHENQLKEELSQIRNHIREMQENLEREEEEGQDGPPDME